MSNKRGIPAIRDRMHELADELGCNELHELADELHRKSPVTRAKRRSPTVTAEVAEEIRQFAKKNPDLHQQDIADEFGVNHGRVSEALNHQR